LLIVNWKPAKCNWLTVHNDGDFFTLITERGNLELLKLFVENGSCVKVDNNYPLYNYAQHNNVDGVKYLYDKGCNPDDIPITTALTSKNNILWLYQ